tara:strand:- start:165 stop:410 length:246 start_codon:yes stop_codon:yes gene_type:complete
MVKVFPVILGELDENFTQNTKMNHSISTSDIQITERAVNQQEYSSRVWYIKAKVFSRVRLYQTNDNYRIQITEEWGDANPH